MRPGHICDCTCCNNSLRASSKLFHLAGSTLYCRKMLLNRSANIILKEAAAFPSLPDEPNQSSSFPFPKRSFGKTKPVICAAKPQWFKSWKFLHITIARIRAAGRGKGSDHIQYSIRCLVKQLRLPSVNSERAETRRFTWICVSWFHDELMTGVKTVNRRRYHPHVFVVV